MSEYIYNAQQEVLLNEPILFNDSIPCRKGYVVHENGEGVLILRGIVNNPGSCYARYQVTYNGNIALPEGGTPAPIAVAITVNGEPRAASKAIVTPAAAEEFNNVTSTTLINVPRGCCFTVSVDSVVANATDTPAPAIVAANSNLVVRRVA